MITPELKDAVLNEIIVLATDERDVTAKISISKLSSELEVKDAVIWMILDYFRSKGIVSGIFKPSEVCDKPSISLNVPAFDLHRMGGFTGLEANAELELSKLKKEIELLKSQLDKNQYDVLMSGIGTVMSVLSFLKP